MEKNNKNKKRKTKKEKDWKDSILEHGHNIVKSFSVEMINIVKEKIHQLTLQLKGNILSFIFLLLSLIFLSLGLIKLTDYYVRIPGVGYLILGLVMLILGMSIKIHYGNKK